MKHYEPYHGQIRHDYLVNCIGNCLAGIIVPIVFVVMFGGKI